MYYNGCLSAFTDEQMHIISSGTHSVENTFPPHNEPTETSKIKTLSNTIILSETGDWQLKPMDWLKVFSSSGIFYEIWKQVCWYFTGLGCLANAKLSENYF